MNSCTLFRYKFLNNWTHGKRDHCLIKLNCYDRRPAAIGMFLLTQVTINTIIKFWFMCQTNDSLRFVLCGWIALYNRAVSSVFGLAQRCQVNTARQEVCNFVDVPPSMLIEHALHSRGKIPDENSSDIHKPFPILYTYAYK